MRARALSVACSVAQVQHGFLLAAIGGLAPLLTPHIFMPSHWFAEHIQLSLCELPFFEKGDHTLREKAGLSQPRGIQVKITTNDNRQLHR